MEKIELQQKIKKTMKALKIITYQYSRKSFFELVVLKVISLVS